MELFKFMYYKNALLTLQDIIFWLHEFFGFSVFVELPLSTLLPSSLPAEFFLI